MYQKKHQASTYSARLPILMSSPDGAWLKRFVPELLRFLFKERKLHDPEIRRMKAASVLLICESLKGQAIVEFTKLKTSPETSNRSMAGAILHFLEQNEFE